MELQARQPPRMPGLRFGSLLWAIVVLIVSLSPARVHAFCDQSILASPARVGFAVQFTGVSDMDRETLRSMMVQRAEAIVARAKRMAANDAQDFWVQAKVARRADEEGNLGFDLRLVGRYQGRSLRWPELGRRCTFCTNGEFVDMFAEAFSSLMDRPMPETQSEIAARDDQAKGHAKAQPAALNAEASLQDRSQRPLLVPPENPLPSHRAKKDTPRRSPRSGKVSRLRWWGWMGLGLSAAGTSSIIASLATMPRNVPVPENPAMMYPFRPDRSTKIGLAVGGSCLVLGVGLWVIDVVTRTRKGPVDQMSRRLRLRRDAAAFYF